MLAAATARAQESGAGDACAPKVFRFEEDCRALASGAREGLERLRYLPLTDSGSLWLTLGGEYRLKTEALQRPGFGIGNIHGYTATGERFLAHLDLRSAAGPRLFVQLAVATDTGRTPFERSFDKDRLNLAQGFIDLPFDAGAVRLLLRAGRQELDFDNNRLIAVRDVTNLRRAFDQVLTRAEVERYFAEAFAGHPVLNRSATFADHSTPGENFWGARFGGRWQAAGTGELFYFARRRDLAIYQGAVGPELRRNLGARWRGSRAGWDWAVQASGQRGEVAAKLIRSYGIALDAGYALAVPWHPRLGVSAGRASGNNDPRDLHQGTFDTLYPNLGYFTDAPLTYPGNDWDVQPSLTVVPLRSLSLEAGVDVLHRLESHDAIYQAPGVPLIPGTGQRSNFLTALSYLRATWHVFGRLDLAAAYVHASVGSLVRSRGGADADYGFVQASVKL